jgi:hypothetical protein
MSDAMPDQPRSADLLAALADHERFSFLVARGEATATEKAELMRLEQFIADQNPKES